MGIVIRQSIKATIVNYVGAFLGFVTTVFVMTRFLKPEEIGLTKVIYEVAALVAGFAQLGTSASAMRFFPYFKNPEKNHNGFFFYLMLMPCIGSLIFVTLFWLLKAPVIEFFESKSALLVDYYNWIIPLVIFLVFWAVLETYANVLLRIVIPKFIREIGVRVVLLTVYLLYAFQFLNLSGLVTGVVLAYGMAMVASLVYVSRIASVSLKHDTTYIDRDLLVKIGKYTLFLVAAALSGNIIGQLDLFMVSSELGLNYAGIYTISFYMATVIEIPARSITAIASPLAASALKDGHLNEANLLYKKVALHQFIAGSTLFLLIWINIDTIFSVIPNGEVYRAGKWVVFFLAMSRLVSLTLSFGGSLISFSRYYYWGLYFTFFLTALTIGFNYLLIPHFGINGAAMATLITCLLSYSFQQWIVLKKIKGNPYSAGIFKQIGLILFLWGLNELLPYAGNPYADGVYRTVIIVSIWFFLTYYFKISAEFCALADKYVFHFFGNKNEK